MTRIVSVTFLALALSAGAAAGRPGPPPDWASTLSQPTLKRGSVVTYRYSATSADPLRLRISIQSLPRQLRVVGTTSWMLEFPGEQAVTKRATIRVRVRSTARAGSRLCLTLQQHALSVGVDDVVPRRVCGRVTS